MTNSSTPYKPSKSVQCKPVLRFVHLSGSVFSNELGVAAIVPTMTVAVGELSPVDVKDGGIEQVGPLGCTEHPNETTWLNPPIDVRVTVKVSGWPAAMDAVAGESSSAKSDEGVGVDAENFVRNASGHGLGLQT
jgi:hypothetical protein